MSISFWPPQLTGGSQLAIYERGRGFELGATANILSKWPERDSGPGPRVLTIRPRYLLKKSEAELTIKRRKVCKCIQSKITNLFLYSNYIRCIVPVRKKSFKSHRFHASINHIYSVRDSLSSFCKVKNPLNKSVFHIECRRLLLFPSNLLLHCYSL